MASDARLPLPKKREAMEVIEKIQKPLPKLSKEKQKEWLPISVHGCRVQINSGTRKEIPHSLQLAKRLERDRTEFQPALNLLVYSGSTGMKKSTKNVVSVWL